MLNVWLPGVEEGAFLAALRAAAGPGIELITGAEAGAAERARVLVRGVPTRAQLRSCPVLERLVIPYAGIPASTRALLREFPQVAVHNLHHNAAPVAELALALLLAVAKDVVPMDRALRAGDWRPRYAPSATTLLAGRSALIAGYGAIGRHLARSLLALGMRVRATRARIDRPQVEGGVEVHPGGGLDALLPEADALLLCLPLTPATEGLVGARELARLPAGALLVNVGRGGLVDDAALYAALAEGRLGGAGLDVWTRYPGAADERAHTPPTEHPFETLDNVVFSPHRGGHVRDGEVLRARALARLLEAVAAGGEVHDRVDLDRGY